MPAVKKVTDAVRARVVADIIAGKLSTAQAAKDCGVSVQSIREWVRDAKAGQALRDKDKDDTAESGEDDGGAAAARRGAGRSIVKVSGERVDDETPPPVTTPTGELPPLSGDEIVEAVESFKAMTFGIVLMFAAPEQKIEGEIEAQFKVKGVTRTTLRANAETLSPYVRKLAAIGGVAGAALMVALDCFASGKAIRDIIRKRTPKKPCKTCDAKDVPTNKEGECRKCWEKRVAAERVEKK